MNRIMFAMPTTGSIKTQTVASLFAVIDHLKARGWQVGFFHLESSDIAMSRNYLASRSLHEGADVLLFVDSDMTFTPAVVDAILDRQGDVTGAIAPKRQIDLQRLVEHARERPADDATAIISRSLVFPIRAAEGAVAADGFYRLTRLGMALTAIRAAALTRLIETKAVVRTKLAMPTEIPTWSFFDPLQGREGRMSEDYSFCSRWVDDCGGEIWGLSTAQVGHIGDLVHAGEYAHQAAG